MLKGSTAHRAYILEVDRDAQGTKERSLCSSTMGAIKREWK